MVPSYILSMGRFYVLCLVERWSDSVLCFVGGIRWNGFDRLATIYCRAHLSVREFPLLPSLRPPHAVTARPRRARAATARPRVAAPTRSSHHRSTSPCSCIAPARHHAAIALLPHGPLARAATASRAARGSYAAAPPCSVELAPCHTLLARDLQLAPHALANAPPKPATPLSFALETFTRHSARRHRTGTAQLGRFCRMKPSRI